MGHRAPSPQNIRTAAELNAQLRELKARSRLTYRQLEERAAGQGELLPRSTLADVLRHGTLPRPELLTAFIRACGEGDAVEEWLAARQRAAGQPPVEEPPVEEPPVEEPPGEEPSGEEPSGGGGRRTGVGGRRPGSAARRRWWLAGGAALAVALVAAGFRLLGDSGGPDAGARPPGEEVLIRPAGSPGLCLTDGQPADGRYDSLVAVQRPCAEAVPPATTLDPAGRDTYRIAWHHPDHGKGCLKALTSGDGKGLLEPWEACGKTTLFRFVPAEDERDDTYRIHVTDTTCVAVAGTRAGAEAVVAPCADVDAQLFVVEPDTAHGD
ncbi:RICIN domain-containing protein [Streptomyces sp. NPDC053367]|uniref:RICIN domain-containing protein n=1 Tax=Streptomyces sp. NPDC053367 TaxID=3365700 RepID=UPI0037D392A7